MYTYSKRLVSAAVVVGFALMGASVGSGAIAAAAPSYAAADTQLASAPFEGNVR
jgi:F0F1-type ATP synthase membrane subunit c/vacuolar-type H+-ATPase subunit K